MEEFCHSQSLQRIHNPPNTSTMLYFFFAALLRLASFSDASTNQSIGSSGWDNDVVGRSKTQTQSTQSIGSSGWDNDVVARPVAN